MMFPLPSKAMCNSEKNHQNFLDCRTFYHRRVSKIDIIKSQVMEFLESVTEARYFVEEANKELDLEGIMEEMDPQGHQDNQECNDEELEVHPEYSSCHPGKIFFLKHCMVNNGFNKINRFSRKVHVELI